MPLQIKPCFTITFTSSVASSATKKIRVVKITDGGRRRDPGSPPDLLANIVALRLAPAAIQATAKRLRRRCAKV
jgi:hypothetical protein